jgi:uncharacterized protein
MMHVYTPAWWVPGPHLRTLWGKFFRRTPDLPTRRERWETPDGDFLDVVRLDGPTVNAPRLLFLHGLEGSPRSHYMGGVLAEARRRGWGADLLIFRSCGGENNRTRRFYHSGETEDFAFMLDRIVAEHPRSPLVLGGVSLGGNVLLKFLGERGSELPSQVRGAVAVSVPFDLGRGSRHIARGFSRIYEQHFLRSLRRKASEKLARFPDLVPPDALEAQTLYEFDHRVTAPVHGFTSADDYYTRSSAIRWIARIRVPTLLLSAIDDPFLPAEVLDEVRAIARENPALTVEFVERGGHVGFVSGRLPWRPLYYAEWRLGDFLTERLCEARGAAPSGAARTATASGSAQSTVRGT